MNLVEFGYPDPVMVPDGTQDFIAGLGTLGPYKTHSLVPFLIFGPATNTNKRFRIFSSRLGGKGGANFFFDDWNVIIYPIF